MLKRAMVLGCLVILSAGLAWSADDTFPMPEDMQKLLPADPAFIVAISSVNDLDRQWSAIEEMMDEADAGKTDIISHLSEFLPRFAEFGDLDRPLAVALPLPDLMAGEEPGPTFIIPLRQESKDEALVHFGTEDVVHLLEGDYLAVSMDPNFSTGAAVPDLARGLKAGFLSSSLDLEMVVEAYGPLAEMGLGAMANAPAQPDTSTIDPGPPAPLMDQDEAAAMYDLARAIMDSARRFDLSLSVENESLTLHTGFAVHPGSPLDSGPQPSFEDALQLTRLLPGGGNIIQAMALDQTRQFEVIKPMYLMSMEQGLAEMPPEQAEAFRAWIHSYLDAVDLFANPVAASISMSEEGMNANMVMESEDAAGDLERFAELFEGLSAADVGITMKKMPTGKVAGVEVRSWTVDYDVEKIAGISTDPMNPQMGGTGRMQAEQMIAFLRKITPNVNMAVRGNYLLLSADANPSNLVHMIQLSGQRRGAAIPEVAAVAAEAGPACQQVVTGDMMSIFAWVTDWLEELEGEEIETIQDNPIPFTSAFTIDNGEYGVDWTMDMPAVKQFIHAVGELEAWDDARRDNSDVGEESEETGGE